MAWRGTQSSLGRVSGATAPRPGLAEVVAVWILFGIVAVEVWVTYARLPVAELYNVGDNGVAAGAGRALVFLNYRTALVAIALLAVVAERLRGRLALVAALGAVLCAVVVWPGVVERPISTRGRSTRCRHSGSDRSGATASRSRGAGSAPRAGSAAGGIWPASRSRRFCSSARSPGWRGSSASTWRACPSRLALHERRAPPEGHPTLTAVHLGHHHGMDGTLLALSALALSRVVGEYPHAVPPRGLRPLRRAHARLRWPTPCRTSGSSSWSSGVRPVSSSRA